MTFAQQLDRLVESAMASLKRRIRMLATRVTVTGVDDSQKIQTVQVTALDGERLADVQRLQPYGFTANPPLGGNGLMICIGGSRTHPVVIVSDDGSKRLLNLAPGECAIYDNAGNFVHIKAGQIHVKHATKVYSESPLTHCSGDAEVDGNGLVHGDLTVQGNLVVSGTGAVTGALSSSTSVADPSGHMAEMRTFYNAHVHPAGVPNTGAPTVPMT